MLTAEDLESIALNDIFSIRTDTDNINDVIEDTEKSYKEYSKDIKTRFDYSVVKHFKKNLHNEAVNNLIELGSKNGYITEKILMKLIWIIVDQKF